MNGIPSFADGFSGGLNQGMGIIRQARQDVASQQQAQFQRQMALRQDARAEKQIGFQENQEARSAELHPVELEGKKTANLKGLQDLVNARTAGEISKIELENLPQKLLDDHESKVAGTENTRAQTVRTRQGTVLDARKDARDAAKTGLDMQLDMARNHRDQQAHDLEMGAKVMPFYIARLQNGLPIPKGMAEAVKRSPISFGNMVDMAESASRFAPVLDRVARGDNSWMNNANDRASIAQLARSRGMSIAQQNGMDPATARITNWTAGKGGTVMLTVAAYDPDKRQYRYVQQPVNSDRLIGEMSNNAKAGTMLAQHPQYAKLLESYSKLGKAGGGDFQSAGESDYNTMLQQNRMILSAATDENNKDNIPQNAIARAKDWMNKYGGGQEGRDRYVSEYTGIGMAAARSRRADTNPWDFDRLNAEAARHTNSHDPNVNMERVNRSLRYHEAMNGKWDKDPELYKFAVANGGKEMGADPARRVRVINAIWKDKDMRQRMLSLTGGPK